MGRYQTKTLSNGAWCVYETEPRALVKVDTFAFDTETLTYLDGKVQTSEEIFEALRYASEEEKRQRLRCEVWAWQIYDERNGFFMTNSFDMFLAYQCKILAKFGWCYNSTFDFAQIDYKILAEQKERWKPHEKNTGKGYNKGQAWAYESLHNDMGARYAYKLWLPYKSKDRHKYVHAVEYRDFMKICTGGLGKLLKNMNVTDQYGNAIRKLTMDYQAVDPTNLTEEQIDYCCNDVKGLYFAIKQFNDIIEKQTNNELHCFGIKTNVMTAGGIAKRELLRSMYTNVKPKQRLKAYQRMHPVTKEQDDYIRSNYLYKGGISFVNPAYEGLLLTQEQMASPMYRYDVNSEYPYAMASIRDLIGNPIRVKYDYWLKNRSDDYEAILILESVTGSLKPNMLGFWYDNCRHKYVNVIDEDYEHLIFETEFNEMQEWYDIDYCCKEVILLRKGDYAYKPYVDVNYDLKATSKADGNATLTMFAKLLLNSAYGKLAERVERMTGHYELNEDTGAIHFVQDGNEADEKQIMSIFNGAKVTSFARCYILSKIREICKNPAKEFVYIDTDSIHAFSSYDGADAYKLGALKLEATCNAVKYLLPKTYIDIAGEEVEVHCKGINVSAIKETFKDCKTLEDYDNAFDYGQAYRVLQAMNVRGGKVLIMTEKYLAREELRPNEKINNGYFNEI